MRSNEGICGTVVVADVGGRHENISKRFEDWINLELEDFNVE